MALADRVIASGAWMALVADGERVGLVTNVSSDVDHGLQPVNVVGIRGPVAYDQLNYVCSITVGAFVPNRRGTRTFPDGGVMSVADFLPLHTDTERQSQQYILDVLQTVNLKTNAVINQWRRVSLASEGIQFQPNSYVAINVRLMAVEKTI